MATLRVCHFEDGCTLTLMKLQVEENIKVGGSSRVPPIFEAADF